jgi:hypothetical protein
MRQVARLVLLAAGVAVIVVLVRRMGTTAILGMLRDVSWRFLAVSVLYTAHVVARAGALWRCLPPGRLRFRDTVVVKLWGEAVELLTFTGPFLAEPIKAYLLKRRGLGLAEAFGMIAVEFLLYTLMATWMAIASLSILLARRALPELDAPMLAILVGLVAFTAGCLWATVTGVGLIVPIMRRVGLATLANRFDPVERVMVGFMHDRPGRLGEVVLIEALSHAFLAAEFWIVLTGLGFPLALADALLFEGGTKLITMAFVLVPGQVGAQEGFYVLLVGALGLPAVVGLTFSLVRRVRALIVAAASLGAVTWTDTSSFKSQVSRLK